MTPVPAHRFNGSHTTGSHTTGSHTNGLRPNTAVPSTTLSNISRATLRHADSTDIRYHLARQARLRALVDDDEGAATAEYAIVIMAGVALAGVLVAIMKSGDVQSILLDLVQRAFGAA